MGGGSPFSTTVPSGRVGSAHDSVYSSNDEFKQNAGMRFYGGALYHHAMAEFCFVAGGINCPQITGEEIVNACGVEDIRDGTNYSSFMRLFFLLASTSLSLATKIWSKYTGVSSQTMSKQKPASKEACLLTGRIYPLDVLEKSEHYNVCSFSFPASTEWNYAIAVWVLCWSLSFKSLGHSELSFHSFFYRIPELVLTERWRVSKWSRCIPQACCFCLQQLNRIYKKGMP
ncbi:hypothetical protein NC653_039169 [Populus alba x Populus x berolinensis]|uniref:Uncharacterized protein n=1 Tax=Populus alba x Populus x berolinensis TaxID=444605 RepID=A0AAD6PQ78_9ROSI|nr:hypothetical protein NC653_039169 [Populus alba x Populus x berolinensis]